MVMADNNTHSLYFKTVIEYLVREDLIKTFWNFEILLFLLELKLLNVMESPILSKTK